MLFLVKSFRWFRIVPFVVLVGAIMTVTGTRAQDAPAGMVAALKGHTDVIYATAFTPDGKQVVTGSFDNTVKLWEATTGKETKTFGGTAGHQKLVLSVAVSADGRMIASGSQDNTAKIWDMPASGALRSLVQSDAVNALALSADGKLIASAAHDAVKIINAADGKLLFTLPGHQGPVIGVAFSANGQQLASCGSDRTLRFWNVADGKPLGVVHAHAGAVTSAAFHPNGSAIYSAGEDGLVKFWRLPFVGPRLLTGHGDSIAGVVVTADGSQVITACADRSVRVFNFASGQVVRTLSGPATPMTSLATTAQGSLIAGGTADSRLFVWNAADGSVLSQVIGHAGPVNSVAFHPQNTQLLSGGGDGYLKRWSMPPLPGQSIPHPESALAMAVSTDGKRIVTGSADKIVRSWNLMGTQMERQFPGHSAAVTAVALSPNGQLLASGSGDATIRFWNQTNGQPTEVLGGHTGTVTALAFHPNSQQLLSASEDGKVVVWQLPLQAPKAFAHPDQVTSLAVTADGTKLLTGCQDKQVRLWNLATGQSERTFSGPSLAVTAVALSPNGELLAAGSADKSLTIWSVNDGKEVKKLPNLAAGVTAVAFHADGKSIAAAGADHIIRLFDVMEGKEIKSISGPGAPITGLLFSSSGAQLFSSSQDKMVQIWKVTDGSSDAKLEHPAAVTSLALSKDGTKLLSGCADKNIRIWSLSERKVESTIATPAEVRDARFNADGSRLVVAGVDHRVRIFDRSGRFVESFQHDGPVLAVAFLPDGKRVVSASADKSARVFQLAQVWQGTHTGPARKAIFNGKGDQVITAGDDRVIKIWQAADGKEIKSIQAHEATITGLSLSADGNRLLSAGADRLVKIWSLANLKPSEIVVPLSTISLPSPVLSAALSPDATRVAAAVMLGETSLVRVFDGVSGRELVSLNQHSGPINDLQFLGDNRTLVSAGSDKSVKLSDVGVIDSWEAHVGGVNSVAYHSNGNQALSGGADRAVKLWDVTPGKVPVVQRTFGPVGEPVQAIALSRDSALAAAASGRVAKIWNVADGKEVAAFTHLADVTSLVFSADKSKLLTGSTDNLARIWDLTTRQEIESFAQNPNGNGTVRAVALHPNNNQAIIAGSEKAAVIHSLSVMRVVPASSAPIRSLSVNPAGTQLLTAGDDKLAKLWNLSTGAEERSLVGAEAALASAAISKSGAFVATGGADKTVRIFNVADGKLVGSFKASGGIRNLTFSPNQQILATAGDDKVLSTWNVVFTPGQPLPAEFGKLMQSGAHDGPVTDVVFAPDNLHYYSASLDKSIRTWKFASDAPTKNFAHPNLVDAVAFNQAGTLLATGCHDGILRIWDLNTAQPRAINAHTTPTPSPIYCVIWSTDGSQLVTGSLDQTLKLWNAADGKLIREFKAYKEKEFEKGHREGVFCTAFSPDGKSLISGSSDRTIKVWNVADGTVTREFVNSTLKTPPNVLPGPPQAHPGWVYSLRFTPDGKNLVSVGNAPSNHGYLAVWNVADGKLISGQDLPIGPLYSIAISNDGKYLALGCGPRGVQYQGVTGYVMNFPIAGK